MKLKKSLLVILLCFVFLVGVVSIAAAQPPPKALRGQLTACLAKACAKEITALASFGVSDALKWCRAYFNTNGLSDLDALLCVDNYFDTTINALCDTDPDADVCEALDDAEQCILSEGIQCLQYLTPPPPL